MRWALAIGLCVGTARTASAASTLTILDDSSPDIGRYASLAIGADGLGLIAYYDITDRDLEVAHCTNVPCTAATLSTLDAGNVASVSGVVVGADGRGIIAYYDSDLHGIKTAHCNDLACTSAAIRVIDVTGTGAPAITIGSDGLPLMAYIHNFTLRTVHCTVPDCSSRTIADVGSAPGTSGTALAVGSNGLGVIGVARLVDGLVDIRRCLNVACSATTPGPPAQAGPVVFVVPKAIAVPADGRPLLAYDRAESTVHARGARCADASCAQQAPIFSIVTAASPDVALQPNGLGWFAHGDNQGRIALRRCTDAACTGATVSCVNANPTAYLSLARASDGRSLVAFHRFFGGLGVAYDVSDACAPPEMNVADLTATDLPAGTAAFVVTLSAPSAEPVTVDYATVDDTARAGTDYVAASGTLTFPPGALTAQIPVTILADGMDEPDEQFRLDLSAASGAILADNTAVATIVDGDPPPGIEAGHCERVEGDSLLAICVIRVSLVGTSSGTVRVNYQTVPGTATADVDYIPMSGQLVFSSGETEEEVAVPVFGDTVVELHETFTVNLSNPIGGTILDGMGEGTILDDDTPSLSSLELTHGSRLTADLAAVPGPLADVDLYRLAQPGYSSWEIVADEVSGDIAPGLVLERLAEDNVTVLQAGVPAGTGSARTLRWQRRLPFEETHQHIRVRSTSCATDCGADDAYRLRAYETTVRIPRFNNSGSQGTVLVVQNRTGGAVDARVDFWGPQGTLLATAPLALAPRAVGVVNTLSLPALVGRSGSVSITHDGPYGALAGKAVALEPATGFSFDSPLSYKPR
ncbi:MAG: Calx-beta domain-containing protein [Vicinamibacteria bacterium]